MKSKWIYLLLIVFLITSCQFTETIVINEDGSGTISFDQDMGSFVAAINGMGASFDNEDSVNIDQINERVDTLIYLSDYFDEYKDSIALLSKEQQEKIASVRDYELRVQLDTEDTMMLVSISKPFTDLSEVNNVNYFNDYSFMTKLNLGIGINDSEDSGDTPDSYIAIKYSLEKNTFKRTHYIENMDAYKVSIDSLQEMAQSMMSANLYTLSYTFPRPIIKVSNTDAELSEDKKTMTLTVPFMEYYLDPKILDLEVTLHK